MKEFKTPELTIVEFELEDIITVSVGGGGIDDGWY
jgi:hypothetical protein